jgi:hypothetical protein
MAVCAAAGASAGASEKNSSRRFSMKANKPKQMNGGQILRKDYNTHQAKMPLTKLLVGLT